MKTKINKSPYNKDRGEGTVKKNNNNNNNNNNMFS